MKQSELERLFAHTLHALAPELAERVQQEYRFHPSRRWRFDFAFVPARVGIEVDGGQWTKYGGRHARDSDREKLNAAAAAGWRVLRFSGAMLKQEPAACVQVVRDALTHEQTTAPNLFHVVTLLTHHQKANFY